jgi:hypothetical protein
VDPRASTDILIVLSTGIRALELYSTAPIYAPEPFSFIGIQEGFYQLTIRDKMRALLYPESSEVSIGVTPIVSL